MNRLAILGAATLLVFLSACGKSGEEATEAPLPLAQVTERYVKLILAIGEHEPGYVDAYYGPAAWADAVKASPPGLQALQQEALALMAVLRAHEAAGTAGGDALLARRIAFLGKQLIAAETRVRMLQGEKFTFDEETRLLFDAVSPGVSERELEESLLELDALVPGEGPLRERYLALRQSSVVPPDKVDAVFQAAIQACKARTEKYIELPMGESFTTEYVHDKPWSGYNWYQGDARSLIQVNLDLPIYIERAIDLGCHEGYPGHHVFNARLETDLVKGRGWMEFSVYPLYSPQSLLAEGTANLGIEMAFPGDEASAFEAATLYPLAGFDPEGSGIIRRAMAVFKDMRYATTEIARRYLDGLLSRDEAVDWLEKYTLSSRARAEQRVDFIEFYRGYIINYTLGMDLAEDYLDRNAGEDPADRWRAYEQLISTPMTASMLKE